MKPSRPLWMSIGIGAMVEARVAAPNPRQRRQIRNCKERMTNCR